MFPEISWYNRYLTAGIYLHIQIWVVDFIVLCLFLRFNFSIFLFLFFTEKPSILFSFASTLSTFFFLNLHTAWKWFFLKQFEQIFPNTWHFSFSLLCFRQQEEHFIIFFNKYRWIFVRWVDFIMVVFLYQFLVLYKVNAGISRHISYL